MRAGFGSEAGSRRATRSKSASVTTFGLGAATMYLFDPAMGKTRRAKLRDQMSSSLRGVTTQAGKKTRYLAGRSKGLSHAVGTGAAAEQAPPNDPALQAKVESEVLGSLGADKGKVNVTAEQGIVTLRGELAEQAQIADLEQRTRKVTGVLDVVNLLHLPGQVPPNKEEALRTDPGSETP